MVSTAHHHVQGEPPRGPLDPRRTVATRPLLAALDPAVRRQSLVSYQVSGRSGERGQHPTSAYLTTCAR